jgi:mannitol 2-dehydrogenase
VETFPVKLNQLNLGRLYPSVGVPGYERRGIPHGIVHIGVGGFHRAHQAVYLDDLLNRPGAGPAEWAICGVGLLPQDIRMREALRPQDGLYTVVESGAAGNRARVIGSLVHYLFAPEDREAVIEKMAAPACRIVSLTITEGGYYVRDDSGAFDETHPDIVRDLAQPRAPACSFGYLAEALDRRRRRGLPPFTVMSCDNLQHNGEVTRRSLLAYAARRDPVLAGWIKENCAFPNSMVDRITPVTTEAHRDMVRREFAIEDAWPVVTEPFRQWVMEDIFPAGRPAWELAGARLTADVGPYEKMKIRLLNASHQVMTYIGILLGHTSTDEAMADADIRKLVRNFMDDEVTPLLPVVPGIDLGDYKASLIERFANPAIKDQLSRNAVDGSVRIPKFVLPSLLEQLKRGGPFRLMSFAVACWFRYLAGVDEGGNALPLVDRRADELRRLARRGGADPAPLLELRDVFGDELAGSPEFLHQVRRSLRCLYEKGARAALAEHVNP